MKSIPNLLTLLNLSSGILAILAVVNGDYQKAFWLLIASLVLDVFDGLVARALGVNSELGIQLDSLADVVSFGVSPGILMMNLIESTTESANILGPYLPYVALMVPMFSALRLAKFNIDKRQTNYFIGVPTPANAILLYSLVWYTSGNDWGGFLLNPWFLSALCVITALLLVAEVPMLSFKPKSLRIKDNPAQITLIAGSLALVLILGFRGLVFIIPLYLLLSVIFKPQEE